jgi:hypothetical protein
VGNAHLIGVYCLLKFVDANKCILFAFMCGCGGSVRNYVNCFLFGGAYVLHFFRLREMACNICDVDQGPRVVIAPLDRFEPCLP